MAADRLRGDGIAVEALPPADEPIPSRLPALEMVLTSDLQSALDRLRATRTEEERSNLGRRGQSELLCQPLGRIGGELHGMDVREAATLFGDGLDDLRHVVPEHQAGVSGNRIEQTMPVVVDDLETLAADETVILPPKLGPQGPRKGNRRIADARHGVETSDTVLSLLFDA
jgi:hypothetical protein